ncbi:MAG: glycosyltransferase [Panacibacter sp.]
MKNEILYQILHWQFSDLNDKEPPTVDSYITIWWQKIPLGHVWWHSGKDDHLMEMIWEAIKPTIDYYTQKKEQHNLQSPKEINISELSLHLQKHSETYEAREQSISIIICTRNRPEALEKSLRSLTISANDETEIIVVDNAPTDGSTKKIVSEFHAVHYVLEERPGLDIARNTGISIASHNIIAFTDDDVIIPVNWVQNVLSCFQDPLTMAVTGIVLPANLNTEAQVIFERDWGFNKGYLPKIFDHRYYLNNKEDGAPVWDIGAGANMAFRKQAFDLVGLFDERLDVGAAGCSGDSEMWFRILAEGWNCCYFPHNYVFHKHRESIDGLKQQLFHYMKGHACALMVQNEKYPGTGNRGRLYQRMPKYYAARFARKKLKSKNHDPFLMTEVKGCIAGHKYYLAHRNEKQPAPCIPPASLTKHKAAGSDTLISLVIPCYNHGHFLEDAIKSIIKQTHKCWEVIVVDDGSTDNTKLVSAQFGNDLKYVKVERVGLGAARNIGAAYSSGDYVVFLDADDFLYPEALEINLYFFNYYKETVMISGGHQRVNKNGQNLPTHYGSARLNNNYAALLQGNYIAMEGSVMYRRDLFPFFHFDTRLPACEDYDMNLRIAKDYPVFGHEKILAAYRIHDNNMSSDKRKMLACAIKVLERQKVNLGNIELQNAYEN